MKTTLRELKRSNFEGLNKLTSNLDTDDLNTEVTILQILNSNGIQDAIRALRTQDYKDYCLFNADVAESVLYLFEDLYPDDNRPRRCIEGIRLFHAGKITKDELDGLRSNVLISDATGGVTTAVYAGIAIYTAARNTSHHCAICTTTYAATAIRHSPAVVSHAAEAYTTDIICFAVDAPSANIFDIASKKKWKEIEVLLRKHLNNII